jgi:hypothetical protein
MRYYLSGTITKKDNFKRYFKDAENMLRLYGIDDIFNPASADLNIPYTENTKKSVWKFYMKYDIKMLVDADVLVLLPNWKKSRGVSLEVHIAKELDIRIIKFNDLIKELLNAS